MQIFKNTTLKKSSKLDNNKKPMLDLYLFGYFVSSVTQENAKYNYCLTQKQIQTILREAN